MTKVKPNLFDVESAFLDLTDSEQKWAMENVPSVPERYLYYSGHWVYKEDSEQVNRQRAIDEVYGAFISIKNDNYGLKD